MPCAGASQHSGDYRDPALIGDYPTASSVFDIDSIGLVRILRLFNDGQDLGGNSIAEKTQFLVAVAYNPLAPDMDIERTRLARKADEGAQLVYTQPIFEWGALERAVADASAHGLPLLVGILPLRTRHAEFMQNESGYLNTGRDALSDLADERRTREKCGIERAQEFLTSAVHHRAFI